MPASLPEQLLWMRSGAAPAAYSARADRPQYGACGPHRSSASSTPALGVAHGRYETPGLVGDRDVHPVT
jgi:hypothetical protein